ncbi:hypothetical protein HW555_003254 [Spodoptera exigua]|uniref:Secreted protein n=1 Tax=Spodoptera exigua TaxID=7107 RepID=A0A835GP73_SPOEX|nr:hypothetical protein HW555_003254 [Spodoptera exigua]
MIASLPFPRHSILILIVAKHILCVCELNPNRGFTLPFGSCFTAVESCGSALKPTHPSLDLAIDARALISCSGQ